ncbi:integral membrane protein [Striga asiatica]|uniref:Integral membrane protein n=1 Tax=Striga asiatica TaxID=4170 RepID=A0A5A7P1D7_STRAF|nr:integral membrane protein [Striga asiatica]
MGSEMVEREVRRLAARGGGGSLPACRYAAGKRDERFHFPLHLLASRVIVAIFICSHLEKQKKSWRILQQFRIEIATVSPAVLQFRSTAAIDGAPCMLLRKAG